MKTIHYYILLICLSFYSCDYISNLDKTGDQDTIYLPLSDIVTSLDIKSPCRIILTNNAASNHAIITGMDFIIDGYELKNQSGTLSVSHSQSDYIQKEKMGSITIPFEQLKTLTLDAPCIISSNDCVFTTDYLNIIINGKGIYSETDLNLDCLDFRLSVYGGINQSHHQLKGKAQTATYYIEGCTDIDAKDLITQNTTITHRSIANCHIHCTDKLTAIIYSTGSVYYMGNPILDVIHKETNLMQASGVVSQFNN